MLGLSMTEMVIAASLLAVLALLIVFGSRRPRRAEKWEKAEIMKRLLALSEREESMQRMKQGVKMRSPQPALRQNPMAKSKPSVSAAPAGAKPKVNVAAAGKAR